jgi:hypothetical protein
MTDPALIEALLPYVDMRRGVSGLCDHGDHGWCFNRNHRECQCDCPCHWRPERVEAVLEEITAPKE